MNAPREIPAAVIERQTLASNPDYSAWVSANAGSGKTHVLAQRVIRLLLSDVEPARILCITFTKAAAANMANKVFDDLRAWTVLDDAALDNAMRKIGVKKIDAAQRARARRLFALALETPGGLKVQTIHAFCTQLLHLFPFEANVPARFEVLDEIAETQMLGKLNLEVLLEAAVTPESPLGRALAQAVLATADVTFQDRLVVGDAVAQVADASDIRMDGFPYGTGMSRGSMLQNPAECGYPKRGVEATGEELLPEHHRQVGDDPGCIGYAAGKLFQYRARRSTG